MELTEAMRTTGTCRRFRPDPVPEEVLRRAFDAARFAPQGGNRQPLRWVVVRDPDTRRALADLYRPLWDAYIGRPAAGPNGGSAPTAGADSGAASGAGAGAGADSEAGRRRAGPPPPPEVDHFARHLAEVPAIVVACAELAALHPTDHELGRLSVVGGASIYPSVQNLCLALRDQGVGTALTTLLCRAEPTVRALLALPDGIITAAHIAVGYPERPFPTRLRRAPVQDVVFADGYGRRLFS